MRRVFSATGVESEEKHYESCYHRGRPGHRGRCRPVSQVCAELNINIEDVTQSIMQEMFCMIMLVNLEKCTAPMETVRAALGKVAAAMNMELHLTREEVFDAMHHI